MPNSKFYTLWIALSLIVVFVLQLVINGFTDIFVLNENSVSQIWRFATAIFLHGGFAHLLYNLFALLLFGLILEETIGSNKFLLVFIITGILANMISFNFYPSSLGASGAIMGIIGTLAILRPMMMVWAFGMVIPMALAAVIWVAGDLIGAASYLAGTPIDNTGNIAHISGIAFGAIFGIILRSIRKKQEKRHKIEVPEHMMRRWETLYMD